MEGTKTYSPKKIKWFTLLRIAGIIVFILVLVNANLAEIWSNIRKVNGFYLFVSILFQVLLLVVKALRWQVLIGRPASQFYQSLGEFFESYAIGVITPGRLGELMKTGYHEKRTGVIASGIKVLVERGLDVGFFIIIAGAALLWSGLVILPNLVAVSVFVFGWLVFIISVLLVGSSRMYNLMLRLYKKLHDVYSVLAKKNTILVVFLSLISNSAAFLSCYYLAVGINLDISLLGVSGGMAVAGLFNMLPVTVMGLGTRELTFLYVFQAFPESQVLALSALIFLVAQIGGGIIALILGQLFLFLAKK